MAGCSASKPTRRESSSRATPASSFDPSLDYSTASSGECRSTHLVDCSAVTADGMSAWDQRTDAPYARALGFKRSSDKYMPTKGEPTRLRILP